jgi:hypothetical protein
VNNKFAGVFFSWEYFYYTFKILKEQNMNQKLMDWFNEMTKTMGWALSKYNAICEPTENDKKQYLRRYYLFKGEEGKKNKGFIVHIWLKPDNIEIRLGLPPERVKINNGFPKIAGLSNPSEKNQSSFVICLEKPLEWSYAFLLAEQVAEAKLKSEKG